MKAFPHKVMSSQQGQGMDLRDYFAAKAMQGMVSDSNNDFEEETLRRENYKQFCLEIARSAYEFADAMMEARAEE